MSILNKPSEYAGKKVRLKTRAEDYAEAAKKGVRIPQLGGAIILVEEWWKLLTGKSWMVSDGNPAAMMYGFRTGFLGGIPNDDYVLYGHDAAGLGHLFHITEIEEVIEDESALADDPKQD